MLRFSASLTSRASRGRYLFSAIRSGHFPCSHRRLRARDCNIWLTRFGLRWFSGSYSSLFLLSCLQFLSFLSHNDDLLPTHASALSLLHVVPLILVSTPSPNHLPSQSSTVAQHVTSTRPIHRLRAYTGSTSPRNSTTAFWKILHRSATVSSDSPFVRSSLVDEDQGKSPRSAAPRFARPFVSVRGFSLSLLILCWR